MQTFFSSTTAFLYQNILKEIFFLFDAEAVHNVMVGTGEMMGKVPLAQDITRSLYAYDNEKLTQKIKGITFANPIGLAAGFDYDAHLTQILPDVGFGFHTVGTVTAEPYEGNTPPRLGRLPKSKSLLVNKGFKSGGVHEVIARLHPLSFSIPLGLSVGATNRMYETGKDQIMNYIETFQEFEKKFKKHAYYELNISCPNLKTGEPFSTPKRLKALLTEVEKLKLKKPVFIKMPSDLKIEESRQLCKIADKFTIAGLIFGNLTKDRKNPDLDPDEVAIAPKGNFSGKPVERRANALLADAYKHYGKRFVLIGCGGVFSAEDAYKKIRLGASLVEMITGMIYMGPQVIGQINKGLVELLERDGFTHISQAVGVDVN